jgi:hypothetical protein
MKVIIAILLTFLIELTFGQSPEQLALDFYAKNILNKPTDDHFLSYHGKINLRYDKHINPIDSQYQGLAKLIVEEFIQCKFDPRGANNNDIKLTFDDWNAIHQQIDTIEFLVPEQTNGDLLIIPKGIKYKKKLKYKKLKGGFIRFHVQNFWHWFFKEKFNLTIEPYCIYDKHNYVWLRVSKNDLEYGDYFFLEMTNNQVTDWCQVSWIQ